MCFGTEQEGDGSLEKYMESIEYFKIIICCFYSDFKKL